MPSHYPYHCAECGRTELRYRNSTRCRACHGVITRQETPESLAADRRAAAESELRALRSALAELRRAFIRRVPAAGQDGRLFDMVGSPLLVVEHVRRWLEETDG